MSNITLRDHFAGLAMQSLYVSSASTAIYVTH